MTTLLELEKELNFQKAERGSTPGAEEEEAANTGCITELDPWDSSHGAF